jgi:hypothetical protein
MKKTMMAVALVAGLSGAGTSMAQAVVGSAAPAFSATDASGKTVSLADYKGKYVVLEWINPECPYSKKHYATGNMPNTQKHAAAKGIAWLSINTSGDKGDIAEVASFVKEKHAAPTALLHDDGKIGRAYGAKTTPHMYLVDPAGKLVYAGAIDSKPSAKPADIPTSVNYVVQAIDEVTAGKPVSRPVTQPYGCSVKYPSA